MGFEDTYILVPLNSIYENFHKRGLFSKRLNNDLRVVWAEEQQAKSRQKRDFISVEDIPKTRVKRIKTNPFIQKRQVVTATDKTFNDELWSQQWYLRDTRSRLDLPKLDLNVLPVYYMGITGKGIRISILDDGIEYTHEDLNENYDPEISWDCNEDDDDPFPNLSSSTTNNHGTRCAGEVAMKANNKKCGVGIAFGAKIGGVRMLDGLVTDRIEGTALGYAQDLVDIYSASWGPNDDGKTVDGPGRLAREAMERGIKEGRHGKGTIYVWASGNGGNNNDNCNCDGYLASLYTISIGSASQKGEFPWYGEACASILAVTYSSGAYKDQMIATTDVNNACTTKHTGTSASAPLAAGIIALALEVNGNLTWRDVQHLIVWTSELAPLVNNDGWQQNSAGFWFNDRFGFGLMNAFGLITAATSWSTVPERKSCQIAVHENSTLSLNRPVKINIPSNGCRGTGNELRYIEHVEVQTNINYTFRGALQIRLISPSGTSVNLLSPRKLDDSKYGFQNWTFMSVKTWGEIAEGIWTLIISDQKRFGYKLSGLYLHVNEENNNAVAVVSEGNRSDKSIATKSKANRGSETYGCKDVSNVPSDHLVENVMLSNIVLAEERCRVGKEARLIEERQKEEILLALLKNLYDLQSVNIKHYYYFIMGFAPCRTFYKDCRVSIGNAAIEERNRLLHIGGPKLKLAENFGSIADTTLILHGTKKLPVHMKGGPRNYNENYNRIQNRVKMVRQYEDYDENMIKTFRNIKPYPEYLPQDIMDSLERNNLYF